MLGDHASMKENNANMEKNKHADSGMTYQGQKEISNFLLILQVTCLCCEQSTGKKILIIIIEKISKLRFSWHCQI